MNKRTILILGGVVALIGVSFVGYRIWKKNKDKKDAENSSFLNVVGGSQRCPSNYTNAECVNKCRGAGGDYDSNTRTCSASAYGGFGGVRRRKKTMTD